MINFRRLAALVAALALAASPAAADFTINGPTTYESGSFAHSGATVRLLTTLSPGVYTFPSSITLDQYGRVTAITSASGTSCGSLTTAGVMFATGTITCATDAPNFTYSSTNGQLRIINKQNVTIDPGVSAAIILESPNVNLSGAIQFGQSNLTGFGNSGYIGFNDGENTGTTGGAAYFGTTNATPIVLNSRVGVGFVGCMVHDGGCVHGDLQIYGHATNHEGGTDWWALPVGNGAALLGGFRIDSANGKMVMDLVDAVGITERTNVRIAQDGPSWFDGTSVGGNPYLGIGTKTPATELDVNGDITDRGLIACPAGNAITTDGTTGKLECGVLGTVSSVGLAAPSGGVFGVSGSPVTGAGTLTLTATGTSGGIPYFSSGANIASSAALTANLPVIGGGAGVAPSVGTRSGNTTAFVTTTGSQTSGNIVSIDASGNHVAAGYTTGTSGHALPFLDGANTWSGAQTFGSIIGTTTTQSGTSYTLDVTDCGTTVKFSNASAVAVTAPSTLPVSCHIALMQTTAGGQITVSAGGGATFAANPHGYNKTFGQYAIIGVTYFDTSTFTVLGDGA